jgi:hypothetical protein
VKEEHELQMLENRMHRKIFGSKKGEVSEQFMKVVMRNLVNYTGCLLR